ncbi:hypothetical protein CERSUDRAFT_91721 [Gelatoporia subvermispora B]|uniref:Uncharacterized protein n=1 Tax=Ceriporiopsis subvermispora (strain B) TaxID=914234 RepID=M2QV55_CERS8|nr:hypothetical protein CERSUDRAFT_91721 [Gelatoporia subvermispora B]
MCPRTQRPHPASSPAIQLPYAVNIWVITRERAARASSSVPNLALGSTDTGRTPIRADTDAGAGAIPGAPARASTVGVGVGARQDRAKTANTTDVLDAIKYPVCPLSTGGLAAAQARISSARGVPGPVPGQGCTARSAQCAREAGKRRGGCEGKLRRQASANGADAQSPASPDPRRKWVGAR